MTKARQPRRCRSCGVSLANDTDDAVRCERCERKFQRWLAGKPARDEFVPQYNGCYWDDEERE